MPELKSVNFKQDNAGCYHSATTILGVQQLTQKHDVSIKMDFSAPQRGKGPCDRKVATLKNHIGLTSTQTYRMRRIKGESLYRMKGESLWYWKGERSPLQQIWSKCFISCTTVTAII